MPRRIETIDEAPAQPFLKWAGGKRQLLATLRRFVPPTFARYYEPFIGSGALFFDLAGRGALDGRPVTLGDCNADLVGCYLTIRDRVEATIAALQALAAGHARDPHGHFYRVRDERFNPARAAARGAAGGLAASYTPELAAMLLYLNRTGYNGLFRLNARGGFNVPVGRYAKPAICDPDNLRAVSRTLSARDLRIIEGPFDESVRDAGRGDFVYFDPPYAPLSPTSDFTSYTAHGFGSADQRRLQETVLDLVGRGAAVVLSNSTAPEITALYRDDPRARRAGLHAHTVPARRAINSKAVARGDVLEYVITNVPQRQD